MIVHLDAVASAALTNSTAETVVKSHVLQPNSLKAGKAYKIRARGNCPSTNSTDTLTLRLRLGDTTLTGDVVAASAAVDVANAAVGVLEAHIYVRADGSIVADSEACLGALGTAGKLVSGGVVTGLDFADALRVELTGAWSVANAGNQFVADLLAIEEVGSI